MVKASTPKVTPAPSEKKRTGKQQTGKQKAGQTKGNNRSGRTKKVQTNNVQLDLFSELLIDDDKRNIIPPKVEPKPIIDTTPRPYTTMMSSHLKDGSIVRQGTQLGFLSNTSFGNPTFNPLDLPISQLTKLGKYIDLRDCYHRLYDNESETRTEDKEERSKLNRLYDDFVGFYGFLNTKKNLDVLTDALG